jgi:short-subunit dehydrogenase involved in D-alanine esterification of teichoic acids
MNISGNTIFIPGGTSGLGLGLALRFQAAGNRVIVAGRREALLEQITTEHPGIESLVLDTTDPEAIIRAASEVQSRWPETNVLITMAGIMEVEDVHTADYLSTAERTVTTNLLGPIRLIAAFTEFFATKDSVIMTVSSGLAHVPLPITPTYNATKAAIHSLTEGIRVQLADTSIQVMELVPPAVQTDLMGQTDDPKAMPLEDFLSETMQIIEDQPEATEILVERVKMLRYAEVNGNYEQVLGMLSSH